MEEYLAKAKKRRAAPAQSTAPAEPEGKKFHDPLAACCAIDEGIGAWAEVELYRVKGEWSSRPAPGSNTWIIVDHDRERFLRTLLAHRERASIEDNHRA